MEAIKMKGTFRADIYENGILVRHLEYQNMLVIGGKEMLVALLKGITTNNIPTKIGFGTSSIAVTIGDTALTSPQYITLGTPTSPNPNEIVFPFSMGTSIGNGKIYYEIGLLGAGNKLFNRIVMDAPIEKNSAISLDNCSFTLTF